MSVQVQVLMAPPQLQKLGHLELCLLTGSEVLVLLKAVVDLPAQESHHI